MWNLKSTLKYKVQQIDLQLCGPFTIVEEINGAFKITKIPIGEHAKR